MPVAIVCTFATRFEALVASGLASGCVFASAIQKNLCYLKGQGSSIVERNDRYIPRKI